MPITCKVPEAIRTRNERAGAAPAQVLRVRSDTARMRVTPSELAPSSARSFQVQQTRSENLLQRTLAQRLAAATAVPAGGQAAAGRPTADTASLSETGKQLSAQPKAQEQQVLDVLKNLFGISNVASMNLQIDVSQVHAVGSASAERSTSTSYDYQDSYTELHGTSLQASGTITLDDGRSFALDLSYSRTELFHSERSVSAVSGEPADADDNRGAAPGVLDPLFTQLANSRDDTAPLSLSALLKSLSTDNLNQRFAQYRQHEADPRLMAFSRSSQLLHEKSADNRINQVA